jgi:hypothetical protein
MESPAMLLQVARCCAHAQRYKMHVACCFVQHRRGGIMPSARQTACACRCPLVLCVCWCVLVCVCGIIRVRVGVRVRVLDCVLARHGGRADPLTVP